MTAADLALLGITPQEIIVVWAWGFSTILLGWILGFGVSLAKALIRRV